MGGSVAACAAAVPPPRCRSLCCRLMASALFGMRAAPSRRNGGPRPSSALPLNRSRRPRFADGGVRWGQKPARPRPGVAAPPLWPRPAGSPGQASAGAPYDRLPPSHFLVSVAVGCSGRTPPPPPRRPVSPVAIKVEWGGLRQRSRAPSGRAGALQPRPPVLAPGRGYFVFAAAGLGIAPPAGGAKGLPGCTRCAM